MVGILPSSGRSDSVPSWYGPDPKTGFGLASHDPLQPMAYQFLQHLPNVIYDDELRAYELIGPSAYGHLHTDLEILHQTSYTWEQYRLFRLAVLSGISLGHDEGCNGTGRWRIEYRGSNSSGAPEWMVGPSVTFDTTNGGLRTATFQLERPNFTRSDASSFWTTTSSLFTGTGFEPDIDLIPETYVPPSDDSRPGQTDLVIRHVSGCHAAFLNVRFIKQEELLERVVVID